MRFERLRLSGFKSFVEPAELEIREGLTGIVGPNGCGKSNLLEALRWVMGESSARSLRVEGAASGMDNVIFAGTARRPARNMADVRLVVAPGETPVPAIFAAEERLQITRSISRGEGSTYSVNGRDVRQKDVQLLFADAATGSQSPALVSQGRVAAIISARPAQRRQLLEDAAGIAGLTVRRNEAEARLKATDQNLERLEDVISALEAQAQSLRRQAQSAARYRDFSDSIRKIEEAILRRQWEAAVGDQQSAERLLSDADRQLEEALSKAAASLAEKERASEAMPRLREVEARATASLKEAATSLASAQARADAARRRLADIERAVAEAREEASATDARARDAVATCERLLHEQQEQQRQLEAARDADQPLADQLVEAQAMAATAEARLSDEMQRHAALLANVRGAQGAYDAAAGRLARISAEAVRLDKERQALVAAQDHESQLNIAKQDAENSAQLISGVRTALEAAEAEVRLGRQAEQDAQQAVATIKVQLASLESEAATLDRLLQGSGKGKTRQPVPGLRAEKDHEAALAAALGDDLLAGLGAGEGPRWHGAEILPDDPPLPAGCRLLSDHVEAPAELTRRLAQVGVIETEPSAELLKSLAVGQRLVDRTGRLWRWDGLFAPPRSEAVALAESLARQRRRQDIEAELPPLHEQVTALVASFEDAQARYSAARRQEQELRQRRSVADREQAKSLARLREVEASAARATARMAALDASIERLAGEVQAAQSEVDSARQATEGLPDPTEAGSAVAAARAAAEAARGKLAQLRSDSERNARALSEAEARIGRLESELAGWKRRQDEALTRREALGRRLEELAADHEAATAGPAGEAGLDELRQASADAESACAAARATVAEAEGRLAQLDRQSRADDALVADLREQRATCAAEAVRGRQRVAAIQTESRERFGRTADSLSAPEGQTISLLKQRLDSLSRSRDRLGIVNLRAAIELEAVEEELRRQSNERVELQAAIQRLRGSIATLNREGRTRLLAALEAVRAHFTELFTTLFGGGTAELQLIDDEDPLQAGLEIRAQPPGKKLQSLSLLSGGEQALTAVALIFALFLANPAPVCVLDEVDAPLDDANVERLTRLLAHMVEQTETRFLIVTHNPVTMAAMDRLYGVTMVEPGVSRLVSVALDEAERLAAE